MRIEKNTKVRWIDIVRPDEKDLAWLKDEFGIHPIILNEIKKPSAITHVDTYKNYLYFIYYFPRYDQVDQTSARDEIDLLITKNAVITVRYEDADEIFEGFRLRQESNSLILTCELLKQLMKFEERQLRHIREKIEDIGKGLFTGKEAENLERLTYLKRDVSEYRIIARLQESMTRSLLVKGTKFWGGDAELYLNDALGDQLKLVSELSDYRDTIADFENTNNQLMNLKINRVVQRLTSLSFIAFPILLLAGLFTMNTTDTPIVNLPHSFWIVIGMMAALAAVLFAYFRKKDWI
jgi:magnesium transporter